jgi:hypothetical protein
LRIFCSLFAALFLIGARHRAVQPPPPLPCELKVLREPVFANWLAADSDAVYVADGLAGMVRVPKDGTSPTFLVDVGAGILAFVMDDSTIYFITADGDVTGSIYSVPKSGGTATLLATNIPAPVDIRVDEAFVYWVALGTIGSTLASDGSIERMAKDGTGRQVLADNLSAPLAIDIDATDVYFGETGLADGNSSAGLRRVKKSGGVVTKLTEDDPILAIATTATDVVYSDVDANNTPNLFRINKAGGSSSLLLSGLAAAGIYVFDQTVYITAQDDAGNTSIVAVPEAGGSTRVVRSVSLDTSALAIDDCAVYYATDSRLERAPR